MKIIIAAAVLAAGIGLAPLMYLGWYQGVAAGERFFIFNRYYGTVRVCDMAGCRKLENY